MHDVVERIWFGEDLLSRIARAVLAPTELLYRAGVGVRGALYDAGVFATRDAGLPTVSIGNVTVGGTGKTPVAAWIASQLAERGARPAIVLRGYGDDEPLVHERLNPGIPVVVSADRVSGVSHARAAGATVAVLDDAFQHRRVSRDADIVLVSADRWSASSHLLPAGPLREPLAAIRRATLVLVTRKAATEGRVDAVNEALSAIAPRIPRSTVRLGPAGLVAVASEQPLVERPLSELARREVRVLTAIGDPESLVAQLEQLGARVTAEVHPDHHQFKADEIERFIAALPANGLAICTLKDAVKLANRWPREAPTLWYVSQRVSVERGVGGVEHVLDELTRTRARRMP
jgi:tetraacyldisaccharide 4'-kinase